MDLGLIGGIVGGLLGIAGGAIGTYASIKNTNGPIERSLMIRVSIVAWVAITIFLVLLLLLPYPYRYLLWIPYGVFLPLGIYWVNKRLAQIRAEDRVA